MASINLHRNALYALPLVGATRETLASSQLRTWDHEEDLPERGIRQNIVEFAKIPCAVRILTNPTICAFEA